MNLNSHFFKEKAKKKIKGGWGGVDTPPISMLVLKRKKIGRVIFLRVDLF